MVLLDFVQYRLPLIATGVYFGVYYGWLLLILALRVTLMKDVKKKVLENRKEKEKVTSVHFHREFKNNTRVYAADRAQLNMLEQMPPFLVSMWLYALFVDPTWAAYLGFAYSFLRCFYYLFYESPSLLLPLVTFPNYAIIAYMMFSVVLKAI